ncbi:antibiotic biosynthesis monooxygenase domain protein [Moniliophthora roreri MCA 2997]|uniref:Antibiotic biosynthesis monooxygenase domain protein n=2 Tax=Moniliophthora roreri TaxID=221103 RepID=V2X7Z6_MONRO|nr:antibiotic biosynthesis monooxygenase domain protein [Moniliophthora roreri MCA 2997]KAI3599997.1 antibiotic biosynthesis monooxygenase domain protein [Moniliophthora roreri]
MAAIPEQIKGKFTLTATVTAVDGKADELQKLLAAARESANSSKEPGTLTYRTSRGVGADSNKFTLFEEYADKEANSVHVQTEACQALAKSGVIASAIITYAEEFQ